MSQFLKRLGSSLVIIVGLLGLIQGPSVLAQGTQTCIDGAANTDFCKNNFIPESGRDRITGSSGILTIVAKVIVYFVGVISVIAIIIGGLRYVLSGSDSNAVNEAKNMIIFALVGLVIAILAQIVVSFVLKRV